VRRFERLPSRGRRSLLHTVSTTESSPRDGESSLDDQPQSTSTRTRTLHRALTSVTEVPSPARRVSDDVEREAIVERTRMLLAQRSTLFERGQSPKHQKSLSAVEAASPLQSQWPLAQGTSQANSGADDVEQDVLIQYAALL
jgi:hypothetical protein